MPGPFDFDAYKKRLDDERKKAAREEASRVERVGLIVEALRNGVSRQLRETGMAIVTGTGWIRVSYGLDRGEKNMTIFIRDKDNYELAYNVQNPNSEGGKNATEDEIMKAVIDWPQKASEEALEDFERDHGSQDDE